MLRKTVLAFAVVVSVAACGKAKDSSVPPQPPLLVAPEDLVTLQTNAIASGPVITGSIEPERNADLRAEVSAVVMQVLKENGEPVKRGDLLVRLDDTAIRDSLGSAQEATRAAQQTLEQAGRQFERMKTLKVQGMVSTQSQEDAEIKRNNAQSDLAAANTRTVQARQQLQRTEVRAPFDGIVSERKVSNGDTAQIGKELIKVIDPTSMRFEGFVSADRIGVVKVGQDVHFFINGYPGQDFVGRVKRVDPSANAVTRQVVVLVDFVNDKRPRVAGLYAEGRIDASSAPALMLPESALVQAGDKAYTWRVKGKTLSKVALMLGARDERSGQWEVLKGLAVGDTVMRTPGANFKDGGAVTLTSARAGKTSGQPVQPAITAEARADATSKGN